MMKIEKEYSLEMLLNTLMSCINDSIDNQKYNVMIPITFAVKLSDVINMLLREENELKQEIPECLGNYNKGNRVCISSCTESLECEMRDCEEECRSKSLKTKKPNCFRHFYENCKQCDNDECIHRTECKEKSVNE